MPIVKIKGDTPLTLYWFKHGSNIEFQLHLHWTSVGEKPPTLKQLVLVKKEMERIAAEEKAKKIIVRTWMPKNIMKRAGFSKSWTTVLNYVPLKIMGIFKKSTLGPVFSNPEQKGKPDRWKDLRFRTYVKKVPHKKPL